jgi:DNA-binding LytR/AlgR family response regulator
MSRKKEKPLTASDLLKHSLPEALNKEFKDTLTDIYKKLLEICPPVKKLAVFGGNYIKLLDINDICYITIDDDRRKVITSDGKEWYLKESLTTLQNRFKDDPKIMSVHRAYIANLMQVDKIFTGTVQTKNNKSSSTMHLMFKPLPEDIKVPVSENNQAKVKQYLGIKLPNTTTSEQTKGEQHNDTRRARKPYRTRNKQTIYPI